MLTELGHVLDVGDHNRDSLDYLQSDRGVIQLEQSMHVIEYLIFAEETRIRIGLLKISIIVFFAVEDEFRH